MGRNFKSKRQRGGRTTRKKVINRGSVMTPTQTNKMGNQTETAFRREAQVIPLPRLMFAPEAIIVDLTYPDVTFSRNNVGGTNLSWRYGMNDTFDPDPTLGSGAVPGYSLWQTGYGACLVVKFFYEVGLANLEDQPLDCVCCPSQSDLGANYSFTSELFANPRATVMTMSAKGGMDRILLKGEIDQGEYYGNVSQYMSNFGSLTGTSPTRLYFNIGCVNTALFVVNKGVNVRATFVFRTIFFKRKTLTA